MPHNSRIKQIMKANWNKHTATFSIHLYTIILIVLLLLTLLFGCLFYQSDSTSKMGILFGSLAVGTSMVFLQQLLQWAEQQEMTKLKGLRIHSILPHREGKEYYEGLINNTRTEIIILGVTASRFLADFAHETRTDSQALIQALKRGVKVKILVPKKKCLLKKQGDSFDVAETRMQQLSTDFANFQNRYFDHVPTHSIVAADDHCLVGPVFPEILSKDSPAIHTSTDSILVYEYLEYFNSEWKDAENS